VPHTLRGSFGFFVIGLIALAAASQESQAQDTKDTNTENVDSVSYIDVNFFADTRLRYQSLSEDSFAETANALTLRIKGGVELDVPHLFSALIEIEGTEQLIDSFNDTNNGRFDRPIILDPDNFELNRFQLQTEIIPKTRFTLGRQSFALDNWRFIGNWKFRQNDQTLDAIRAETTVGKARLNVGYFNKVHRHFGDNSPVGEFSGDSFVFNLSHPAPLGQVSLFHYALDLETGRSNLADNTLSSQTTGVRWQGRHHWDGFGLAWDASLARQSDFADNPDNYAAYYKDIGFDVQFENIELSLGLETLGSDNNIALQTPLGTLHSFQGLTDRFFRTPTNGLKDYHASTKFGTGTFGSFENIQVQMGYHAFKSTRNNLDYGRELNFSLSTTIDNVSLLFELGDYNSQSLTPDERPFTRDAQTAIFSISYSFD